MSMDALKITPEQEWDLYQADPRAAFDNITSGLRKSTVSCQYFVKNVPKICKYWENGDPGRCKYGDEEGETGIPSGYGGEDGRCDFLGRRSWCDRYAEQEEEGGGEEGDSEDKEEWICIAPDPYRSGLTKLKNPNPELKDLTLRSVLKEEILGYCEDEDSGSGLCDGHGCGRGCDLGEDAELSDIVKMPILCPYYKPWRMGFGAIEPQSYHTAIKEYGMYYEDAYEQFLKDRRLGKRLPISFQVYNMRAHFQKCMWWLGDPGVFVYDVGVDGAEDDTANDAINLSKYPGINCGCPNRDGCDPYCNISLEWDEPQFLLRNIWSNEAKTVLCNGAKPECPCYTGRWDYCLDKKMYPGMKITAYQILELRFWTWQWKDQEQYERFFENRPNWHDPTTADIYTFTRWEKGQVSHDGTLIGKKFKLMLDSYSEEDGCRLIEYNINSDYEIEETEIKYAKYSVEGTTTEDQVHYPTLVRSLWDFSAKRLLVVYPYINRSNKGCDIRSNLINNAYVTTVGYTEENQKVYVVNSSFVDIKHSFITKYSNVLEIQATELEEFYKETNDYVTDCLLKYPNYIQSSMSDTFGIFVVSMLRVEYTKPNELYILVDCDGVWTFDKRIIFPRFCGGVINQTSFEYKPVGTNYLPRVFMPSAKAEFSYNSLGDSDYCDVFPVGSSYLPAVPPAGAPETIYYYSLDWVEKEDQECYSFTTVGPTYFIWAEILDINLNYVFKWEFLGGTVEITKESESEDEEPVTSSFELELLFPTDADKKTIVTDGSEYLGSSNSDLTNTLEQLSIPPNAVLLKPKLSEEERKTIVGFSNSEVSVKLSYRYLKLCTSTSERVLENVAFPPNANSPTITFSNHPAKMEFEEGFGFVDNIRSGTLGLMALFKDFDGRYISAFATRLYVNVSNVVCRNVEIMYNYKCDAMVHELMPTLGSFADHRAGTRVTGSTSYGEMAPCGDHDCSNPCIGPMWYPFNECSYNKKYNLKTGAGVCQQAYDGSLMGRADFRYCKTHKHTAWSGFSVPFSECHVPWQLYYTIKAGEDRFAGYGSVVGSVDPKSYVDYGWKFPPFGNIPREYTERYLSKEHICYIDYSYQKQPPFARYYAWVPTVIDNSSFYMSFNCFGEYSETNATDCFTYVDQMNFWLYGAIQEEIVKEEITDYITGEVTQGDSVRFSWEELFNVVGLYAYSPGPLVYPGQQGPYAYFYTFIDDSHSWAWQEHWKDIVRDVFDEDEQEEIVENKRLDFIKLIKPSYRYDSVKTQHRFICEELVDEDYYIVFYGPEYSEGQLTKLPSLGLVVGEDDTEAYHRYFEIMHENYDATFIEWNDEGEGDVDGSSGENIYELTSQSPWINYDNMLYAYDESDDTTEEAEAGGRVFFTPGLDGWEKEYYNRGIIVHMLKSDILNLPVDEEEVEYEIEQEQVIIADISLKGIEALLAWKQDSYWMILNFGEEGVCISKIVVKGRFGLYEPQNEDEKEKSIYISKTGFTIEGVSIKDESVDVGVLDPVTPTKSAAGSKEKDGLVEYTVEKKFTINPKKVIEDRIKELTLTFNAAANEGIIIDEFIIYGVEYSEYYYEKIKPYERKFIVSKFNNSMNTNSENPDKKLSSNSSFINKNGWCITSNSMGLTAGPGPFINAQYNIPKEECSFVNKMRSIYSSKDHSVDGITEKSRSRFSGTLSYKEIDVTIGNLHGVESVDQMKLYQDAFNREKFGDSKVFGFIKPIGLESNKSIRLQVEMFNCVSKRLEWKDHSVAQSLVLFDLWEPGGHKWVWSSVCIEKQCYFIPTPSGRKCIYLQQLDHVNHGSVQGTIEPITAYASNTFQSLVNQFTGL